MRVLAASLVVALVLAGCMGGGSDPDPADADGGEAPGGGDAPAGNGTAGSARVEAPLWSVGQSWTWRLSSGALQAPVEATTVVLATGDAGYDVGVTDALQGTGVLPFHLVGLGAVESRCLCWQAHGTTVELVRFPLAAGDRYSNDFWSAPGAQVEISAADVDGPNGPEAGFRSTVSYADGGVYLAADYSPQLGQFVRVATYFGGEQPFAEAVLLRAGDGAQGVGFRATDLARFGANAGDPASLAPHPINVPPGSELVMLACFLPADEGGYGAELTTAGVPLACAGASPPQTSYAGTSAAATAGPGTVTAVVGGESAVNIEVFAIDTSPPG